MKSLTLFSLAALLAANPAVAGDGGRPSDEQIAAVRAELFAASDGDGDGALEITEFTTFTELAHAERVERRFGRLDQDGDGLVSSEELENGDSHPRRRRGGR